MALYRAASSFGARLMQEIGAANQICSIDFDNYLFTGAGDKAFCTGGNTKEYAEYYAGQPEEYRQYMRLFNDMVTASAAARVVV